MRLPTHPAVLASVYNTLPRSISERVGLVKGDDGSVKLRSAANSRPVQRGRYWNLPLECCAICFRRLEREAGVDVDVRPAPKPAPRAKALSIPSADPLHPKKGLIALREKRAEKLRRDARKDEAEPTPLPESVERPSLLAASPNGIKYLDALANVPYATLPCADRGNECTYCYYCIASQLLDENAQDEIQEGGWECIRCGERVTSAARVEIEDH